MNYVFLKGFSYTLFTRTLLLFRISFNILQILLGAAIPVTLTKNQVKAIYLNLSGKSFLPLKLPMRKICKKSLTYKKACLQEKSSQKKNRPKNLAYIPDQFRYFKSLLKKRSRLQNMSLCGWIFRLVNPRTSFY